MTMASLIAESPDPTFKARANHEYGSIRRWAAHHVQLDTARILDFGCGSGVAAASFALRHPEAQVFGSDITDVNKDKLLDKIRSNLNLHTLPTNLHFLTTNASHVPDLPKKSLDLVYAWSVFEHIRDDVALSLLRQIRKLLSANGVFFLQIHPLYFSAKGAHLYRYLEEPWVHLLKDLNTLHDEFRAAAPISAREWAQFMELNRLTADDVAELCSAAGFRILRQERLQNDVFRPPARLLRVYTENALFTDEVRLLLQPAKKS